MERRVVWSQTKIVIHIYKAKNELFLLVPLTLEYQYNRSSAHCSWLPSIYAENFYDNFVSYSIHDLWSSSMWALCMQSQSMGIIAGVECVAMSIINKFDWKYTRKNVWIQNIRISRVWQNYNGSEEREHGSLPMSLHDFTLVVLINVHRQYEIKI